MDLPVGFVRLPRETDNFNLLPINKHSCCDYDEEEDEDDDDDLKESKMLTLERNRIA